MQDGVELGVYLKDAMEAAGKPFAELPPEQISAALREYEIVRSHRVAHIVGKSGFIGTMFLLTGFLVTFTDSVSCLSSSSLSLGLYMLCLHHVAVRPSHFSQGWWDAKSTDITTNADAHVYTIIL